MPGQTAREAAGTAGDPAKVLQSLPGVGRGGAAGDLVLWGSEPRESRVEVDGVELPRLYHGSGVRSVIPAGMVAALHSVPGAYGSERGRALGGLVLMDTQSAETAAPKLRASADLLDVSVLGSVPLRRIDGAVEAGARYGYVDRWLPPLIDPSLRGLYRVPRYWDAHAELNKRLSVGEMARLVFLTSADASQTELRAADPALRTRAHDALNFGRIYLQYHDLSQAHAETLLTPFVGWDRSQQTLTVGAQDSGTAVSTLRYGLRARHHTQLGPRVGVAFGIDANGSVARVERRGSLSVPRREGDPYPFGTPPGASYASDSFRAHVLGVAPFAEVELRLAPGLRVTPSLRFESALIEANRSRPPLGSLPETGTSRLDGALEPRLFVDQRLSERVRLFGAVGRYHQPPDVVDLSARFGNPSLGLASATHVAGGETVSIRRGFRLELTLFAKWLNGLPVRSLEPETRLAQSLLGTGSGRAFGSQLLLRQAEVHGLSGWVSATLSRSERIDASGQARLSDFDAPLSVAAALSRRLGAFRLGARARFASGTPRTPVVGAYYDLAQQRYEPLLGAINSLRLRDFFQLDLRVDRRFELGSATSVELYLDAFNVTFQKNQEELAYSSDFSRIGSVSGLPTLAILGVTLER